ncbi:MAG: DNA translocase FtsK [Candidatus Omnitrophica bacterium]|nr:DNA translocase FtsK [Candidatus Omnitrophota bacterium]MDE2221838.1 DNA translocase FtsK [Candidatus Omnitrophota bacterium]
MKLEHLNEIKGIVILGFSLILLASLVSFTPIDLSWFTSRPNDPVHNWIGIAGAYAAGIFFFMVGYSAYFLVGIGIFFSWNKFTSRDLPFNFFKFLSILILFIVAAGLFSFFAGGNAGAGFINGGVIGDVFSGFLVKYFQPLGALIILFTLGALALVVAGEFLVSPFFVWLGRSVWGFIQRASKLVPASAVPSANKPAAKMARKPVQEADEDDAPAGLNEEIKEKLFRSTVQPTPLAQQPAASKPAPAAAAKPNIHIVAPPKTEVPADAPKPEPKVVGEYHLPAVDLLNDPPPVSNTKVQENLMNGAKILEETLADFGVNVKVVDIERGPVITRYELQPAPGVKIQSIASLSDDLALALSAQAVRILAPIPGKNRVGIEVPNGASAAVFLKDVLTQGRARHSDSKLDLAIGKDTSGHPVISDLSDMPHLLVAGTTGSGKTVCLNSLIMSILFKASPSEVKFIMIDPKMVEMIPYNDLPHLLCPVVTDAKKVPAALNWVVMEMENRYKTLSKEAVRNIKGYHAKGLQMPYIIVVVDELADLMQTSAKAVEGAITRLAQLARAVGIHLILATQRPSVDVITGVIKANFPSRISFKVASKVDSRTVLDTNGAETLLGKGDFLFMRTGDPKPLRGQCCYVSDEEINRVIDFIKKQGQPEYNESVLKPQPAAGGGSMEEKDEMYDEAVRVVIETNQASVTILQRRLRLGYGRAARLVDMMEQNGIVGPYAGSKARDILVDREKWLLENMGEAKTDVVDGQQQ